MTDTVSTNKEYENLISFLRSCRDKGLSRVVVNLPNEFDYLDFEAYVNKIDKQLIYSSKPSWDKDQPGISFRIYQTEETFLDEICSHLCEMYASNSYQQHYLPDIPNYLKPYDIKKWWEYITNKINIVENMYIDRNGILVIKICKPIYAVESEARSKEAERIAQSQSEAFIRKINRIIEGAIATGKRTVEFNDISNKRVKSLKVPSLKDMRLINKCSIIHLNPEEVFTFAILVTSNDIDREFERFEDEELDIIANMIIGKSACTNHDLYKYNSDICIYKAQVIEDPKDKTFDGKPLKYVKAYAYIANNALNQSIIKDINKGVRGGVSISITCDKKECSICGKDDCTNHINGELYDGKICYNRLKGINDVTEFSFVDLPSNTKAVVIPDDEESTEIVYDSEFDRIINVIYNNFMNFVEGFSYISRDKSLVVNLKEREENE